MKHATRECCDCSCHGKHHGRHGHGHAGTGRRQQLEQYSDRLKKELAEVQERLSDLEDE